MAPILKNYKELTRYAACDIADALLKLGVPGAGFLADIAPIPQTRSQSKVIAPASTILMLPKSTPSFPSPSPAPEDAPASYVEKGVPYADLAEFDTVVIISQPAGQSCAVVGGIMAARMRYLGVQGVVVDGRVRDLETLRNVAELMPIWAKGTSIIGAGAETKFHATDVTVRIGEVVVQPGDVVMIDPPENGVVVIPRNKLEEVLEMVPKLVEADEKVMQDVERGGSVKEAFAKFR